MQKMTELKTLKELNIEGFDTSTYNNLENAGISIPNLDEFINKTIKPHYDSTIKKEAIKWVNTRRYCDRQEFMEFHNITEEDLK